jgi:hypothetical protein
MNGTPEHFNEKERKDLNGADIRFTTKDEILYAFAMGQNATETRIAALAPPRAICATAPIRVQQKTRRRERLAARCILRGASRTVEEVKS